MRTSQAPCFEERLYIVHLLRHANSNNLTLNTEHDTHRNSMIPPFRCIMQARLQQHAASQSVRLSLPLSPSLTLELDYLCGRNDSPCLLVDLLERRNEEIFLLSSWSLGSKRSERNFSHLPSRYPVLSAYSSLFKVDGGGERVISRGLAIYGLFVLARASRTGCEGERTGEIISSTW